MTFGSGQLKKIIIIIKKMADIKKNPLVKKYSMETLTGNNSVLELLIKKNWSFKKI